jgi:RNA-binding protein YhbY
MKVLAIDITTGNKANEGIITWIGADGLCTNLIMQLDDDLPYSIWAEELKKYTDVGEYDKIIISKEGTRISLATELEKILDESRLVIVNYESPLERQESLFNLIDTGILEALDINLKLATHKLSDDKSCIKLDDQYYSNRRKSVGIIRALKLINDFYINIK